MVPARVLHILGTAAPAGTAASAMVLALAQGLDPSEFEIGACFLGESGPWLERLRDAGVCAARVPWRSAMDVSGALRVWSFLRARHVDLLHVHFGGRSVRWLGRSSTGARLVVHRHGRVRSEDDVRLDHVSIGDADLVIATSRAVADLTSAREVRVIYPGVKAGHPVTACREPWTIGAAGRLVPLKGYDRLLEAVAVLQPEFPQLRVEIAGEGPALESLRALCCDLRLESRVRFVGWSTDLPALMRRWSLFVQPSREEAFGMAALEAMAAGLPVVASNVGGLGELVESDVSGLLVPPDDARALARALASLLREPDRLLGLAQGAHARAGRFTEARFVEEVARAYRSLLAGGTRA